MLKIYNPNDLSIIINEQVLVSLADKPVEIAFDGSRYFESVGLEDVVYSRKKLRPSMVALALLQSSESNAVLDAIRLAEENGEIGFSLLIKSNSTGEFFSANQAIIWENPQMRFYNQAEARLWKIRAANYDYRFN